MLIISTCVCVLSGERLLPPVCIRRQSLGRTLQTEAQGLADKREWRPSLFQFQSQGDFGVDQ